MADSPTKVCTKCGAEKPLTEFYRKKNKNPVGACRQCCLDRNKANYEAHRQDRCAKQKIYSDSHREEKKAARRARYIAHREEILAKDRAYRKEHGEEVRARNRAYNKTRKKEQKDYDLRRLYGIGVEEFDRMRLEQKSLCYICHRKPGRLCVDHSHNKSHVRHLLCDQCNFGLGLFKDSPELLRAAAIYLENTKTEWSSKQVELALV
jgi:hypothetical protein